MLLSPCLFGTSFSILQLAFGGVLNAIYSVALLLVIALVWRGFTKMRAAQIQWYNQWESVSELCHKQLDEIKQVDVDELMEWMRSGWLTDLAARLDASMGLPSTSEASADMMHCALRGKPYLFEQDDRSNPWEKLPGLAILLGLLGTFIGLTFALTQLPFQGNLKQLTGGLQQVLPLMGTAFWTSVCGLVASLALRVNQGQAVQLMNARADAYDRLHNELTRRFLRELYPLIHKAGLGGLPAGRASRQLEGDGQSAITEEVLASVMATHQAAFAEEFSKGLAPLLALLQSQQEMLQSLPDHLSSMTKSIEETESSLGRWREQLDTGHEQFAEVARHLDDAVAPIVHTERLLSERVASLSRQQEIVTQSLEAIARREETFPERLREILTMSLRPAHQSVQRTSKSLQSSLELVFEQEQKERQEQRRLFEDLGERFSALDRLTGAFEKSAREIRTISDTLLDLSNRLRFRMMPDTHTPGTEEETPQDHALDREIEQLLEGFDSKEVPAPPTTPAEPAKVAESKEPSDKPEGE